MEEGRSAFTILTGKPIGNENVEWRRLHNEELRTAHLI